MRVFISFSGKDREKKNRIVAELRNALDPDDEVWESDEGCLSDFSTESIAAIRASQVFIVLLSQNSMAPTSYVISEVIEARQCEMQGKLNMMVYQLDSAPQPENFRFQINHISVSNWIAENDEDGIRSLIQKAKHLLLLRKIGNPEKPSDVVIPELNGVTIGRASYYVEHSRDTEIEDLQAALAQSSVVFCIQLEGYGRKTAVRKYAEICAENYKKAMYFPQFSGTLWDFFLNGLEIENINDSAFEGRSEFERIRKKIHLLEKLEKDTLLLIPNVTVDDRDYRPLLDMLGNLQCRIVIIAQSIPGSFAGVVPVVQIGRMTDECLLEMFFHYYDHANEDEKQVLIPALLTFFEAVEGHTKTVELTASIFQEEYIMPDELPGKLEEVGSFSADELGDRIYQSVCGLFNMTQFEETDRKIMLFAALMADTAVPEKEFARMLKAAGLFSGTVMKKLCDRHWIDRDSEAKTLSMNRLLCRVCLSRLPLYEDVLNACFEGINDVFLDHTMEYKRFLIRQDLLRIRRLWKLLKLENSVRIVQLELYAMDDESFGAGMKISDLDSVNRKAEQEQKELPEGYREASSGLLQMMTQAVRMSFIGEMMPDTARQPGTVGGTAVERMLDLLAGDDREEFVQLLTGTEDEEQEEDPERQKIITAARQMLTSRNIQQLADRYLSFVRMLVLFADRNPDSEDLIGTGYLAVMAGNVILMLTNSSYMRLMIYRAQEELNDIGIECSAEQEYQILTGKMDALTDLGEYTQEMDEAYETAMKLFDSVKKEFYKDEQEAEDIRLFLRTRYIAVLTESGRASLADEVCRSCFSSRVWTADMFGVLVRTMSSVVAALFREGETEQACAFLKDTIPQAQKIADRLHDRDDRFNDAVNELETLRGIRDAVENPQEQAESRDDPEVYMDYYRSYSMESGNRRRMDVYLSVAKKAAEISCRDLTDEGLKERREQLFRRAGQGENWQKLAPEAFALFSEAGRRTLGYYMHYVQFIGAAAVFDGGIAEMQNGEGKTYTIALAAFMHVLYGRKVHVLDTSAYLSRRNFTWMRGLLESLGCVVGFAGNNSDMNILPHCDVLYGTMSDVLFLKIRWKHQAWHRYTTPLRWDAVIVDEADEGMVADATELIMVSGEKNDVTRQKGRYYRAALKAVQGLKRDDSAFFTYKHGSITLKAPVMERMEACLEGVAADQAPADQALAEHALRLAIRILLFYEKGKDYFITRNVNGEETACYETNQGELRPFTGEFAFFVWAREGRIDRCRQLRLEEAEEMLKYSVMSLLKEYSFIGGASATVSSLEQEFREYYGLEVFRIPPEKKTRRTDHLPRIFMSLQEKERAVANLAKERHMTGQPVLIICGSVQESVRISRMLMKAGMEPVLFNAVNRDEDPDCLQYAGEKGRITVTTALANRGVDICLGGNPSVYAKKQLIQSGVDPKQLNEAIYGMNSWNQSLVKLRKKYTELRAYFWYSFSEAKEEVEQLGGLCVIGTTCFDDLRIEQQVRGRCGRQGCPGESYMFYSLDDETLSLLIGDKMQMFRSLYDGQMDSSPLLLKSIHNARLRIQHTNSRSRMNTPTIKYFDSAENRMLATVPEFTAPDADLPAFIRKQIMRDSRYEEDLNELKGKQIRRADSLVRYLYGKGMPVPERRRPVQKLEQMCDYIGQLIDSICEQTERKAPEGSSGAGNAEKIVRWKLADGMLASLHEKCAQYLETMHAEISSSSVLIRSDNRREHHLKEFSERLASRLYDEAIEQGIRTFLMKNLD